MQLDRCLAIRDDLRNRTNNDIVVPDLDISKYEDRDDYLGSATPEPVPLINVSPLSVGTLLPPVGVLGSSESFLDDILEAIGHQPQREAIDLTGLVDRDEKAYLGGGSFGDVYKGIWKDAARGLNFRDIVVKVPRSTGMPDGKLPGRRMRVCFICCAAGEAWLLMSIGSNCDES